MPKSTKRTLQDERKYSLKSLWERSSPFKYSKDGIAELLPGFTILVPRYSEKEINGSRLIKIGNSVFIYKTLKSVDHNGLIDTTGPKKHYDKLIARVDKRVKSFVRYTLPALYLVPESDLLAALAGLERICIGIVETGMSNFLPRVLGSVHDNPSGIREFVQVEAKGFGPVNSVKLLLSTFKVWMAGFPIETVSGSRHGKTFRTTPGWKLAFGAFINYCRPQAAEINAVPVFDRNWKKKEFKLPVVVDGGTTKIITPPVVFCTMPLDGTYLDAAWTHLRGERLYVKEVKTLNLHTDLDSSKVSVKILLRGEWVDLEEGMELPNNKIQIAVRRTVGYETVLEKFTGIEGFVKSIRYDERQDGTCVNIVILALGKITKFTLFPGLHKSMLRTSRWRYFYIHEGKEYPIEVIAEHNSGRQEEGHTLFAALMMWFLGPTQRPHEELRGFSGKPLVIPDDPTTQAQIVADLPNRLKAKGLPPDCKFKVVGYLFDGKGKVIERKEFGGRHFVGYALAAVTYAPHQVLKISGKITFTQGVVAILAAYGNLLGGALLRHVLKRYENVHGIVDDPIATDDSEDHDDEDEPEGLISKSSALSARKQAVAMMDILRGARGKATGIFKDFGAVRVTKAKDLENLSFKNSWYDPNRKKSKDGFADVVGLPIEVPVDSDPEELSLEDGPIVKQENLNQVRSLPLPFPEDLQDVPERRACEPDTVIWPSLIRDIDSLLGLISRWGQSSSQADALRGIVKSIHKECTESLRRVFGAAVNRTAKGDEGMFAVISGGSQDVSKFAKVPDGEDFYIIMSPHWAKKLGFWKPGEDQDAERYCLLIRQPIDGIPVCRIYIADLKEFGLENTIVISYAAAAVCGGDFDGDTAGIMLISRALGRRLMKRARIFYADFVVSSRKKSWFKGDISGEDWAKWCEGRGFDLTASIQRVRAMDFSEKSIKARRLDAIESVACGSLIGWIKALQCKVAYMLMDMFPGRESEFAEIALKAFLPIAQTIIHAKKGKGWRSRTGKDLVLRTVELLTAMTKTDPKKRISLDDFIAEVNAIRREGADWDPEAAELLIKIARKFYLGTPRKETVSEEILSAFRDKTWDSAYPKWQAVFRKGYLGEDKSNTTVLTQIFWGKCNII